MIIYSNTLEKFRNDVLLNQISSILLKTLREKGISGGSKSEVNSWNNSLHFMKDVLEDPSFSKDCLVAVEYNIPQTSKRVDFMILGNDGKEDHLVIVELKQWAKVEKVDDLSSHSILSDLRKHEPVAHPSYQAYSYKRLILDYCKDVNENRLNPCAYLHNLDESYRNVIKDPLYSQWFEEAPVFLQNDVLKIRNFIKSYVTLKAIDSSFLYEIGEGRLRPSKSLQDCLDSMLSGNEEFHMIDEQVVAYDKIMKAIHESISDDRKHVLIITGGPGTGKSVLAINVLAKCIIESGLNASYITKNSAPRNCYQKLLAKGNAKKMISLQKAIQSPFCLPSTPENGIDVGIFDEAHRMEKKPYHYEGENMLYDAIRACKVSIFFMDEDQRISTKDIYDVNSVLECAKNFNAVIHPPYELSSQFRCDGSDGYISFLDDVLEIKKTANPYFDFEKMDVKVFDSPSKMRGELRKHNDAKHRSRMLAGYCFDWNVKNRKGDYDIVLEDGFKAKWNLENDKYWAINPSSFEEVGCVYTCQGMEFDYVGVFIGKDLYYDGNHVRTNRNEISKDDRSSGIRFKTTDDNLADKLIRRTYKVLLTRGLKGCYIYCCDKALGEYLKEKLTKRAESDKYCD